MCCSLRLVEVDGGHSRKILQHRACAAAFIWLVTPHGNVWGAALVCPALSAWHCCATHARHAVHVTYLFLFVGVAACLTPVTYTDTSATQCVCSPAEQAVHLGQNWSGTWKCRVGLAPWCIAPSFSRGSHRSHQPLALVAPVTFVLTPLQQRGGVCAPAEQAVHLCCQPRWLG
jgi:hypothetical protein